MNKVEVLENGNVKITIPMSFRNCAGRKRIVTQKLNSNFNEPIITNLARTFRWQALIDSGKFSNDFAFPRNYPCNHRRNFRKGYRY